MSWTCSSVVIEMIRAINNSQLSIDWTSAIIGFVWSILTGCFAILNIYIFIQPHWIGDTLSSPRAGYFGLYSYCVSENNDYEFYCQGSWTNFRTILNIPFIVSTFFVGLSLILILVCLILFLLFFCFHQRFIYFICACLQSLCTISLLIALLVYPSGFDSDTIREVCGENATSYHLDTCQIRWAFILAMIGFFKAAILAFLALFLGIKQSKSESMTEVINPIHMMSKYGQLNEGFDDPTLTESNKSTTLICKHWLWSYLIYFNEK